MLLFFLKSLQGVLDEGWSWAPYLISTIFMEAAITDSAHFTSLGPGNQEVMFCRLYVLSLLFIVIIIGKRIGFHCESNISPVPPAGGDVGSREEARGPALRRRPAAGRSSRPSCGPPPPSTAHPPLRRSGSLLLRCPSAAALQAAKVWTPTPWTRTTVAMSGTSAWAI